MTWVLAAVVAWLVVAVLLGVLIGRGIRLADRKETQTAAAEAASPNFVVDDGPLTDRPGTFAAGTDDALRRPLSNARPPAPRPASENTRSTREHGLT